MCGIVGYVGDKQAQDVVIEGLRRLEYRGYDSAGIALVARRPHRVGDKRAGKLANLEKALADEPAARRPRPASGTPAGPPTARPTTPTPTRTSATRGRVALVHNGIIENFADAARRARGGRCTSCARRPTPRSPPTCSRARWPDGGDLTDGDARGLPAARGRVHAGRRRRARTRPASSPPGATPRWWSGSARARTSSAPTSPRSSSTPARRSSSGRTRSSRSPATASSVTDFDGTPGRGHAATTSTGTSRPPRRTATTGSCARRSSSSRGAIADALLGRHDAGRAAPARRGADLRRRAARGRQDHHHRVRHGVLRRPRREVRHRALDPHPVRGRARPRVPLPRPDPDPRHARRRDQPVRRDRRHADGDPPRARAAREGAGDLQHQRLDDPARVRRGDLHPRRPRDRGRVDQGLHDPAGRLLPARRSTSRRCAGTKYGDEIAARGRRARARCPATCSGCSTAPTSSTPSPRSSRGARSVLFLGRHAGFPIALEGALKLKELAYIHAEGFAAGELKHGPIALIEPGLPVFCVVPPQGRDQLHDKMVSAHPGDPGPRRAHDRAGRGGRRRRRAVRRRADPLPARPHAAAADGRPSCRCSCSPASWPPLMGHDVDQPRNLAKSVTVE